MILPPHGHGAAYDPELAALMGTGSVDGHSLLPGDIPRLRELTGSWRPSAAELAHGGTVHADERVLAGVPTHPDLPALLLWPTSVAYRPRPALLHLHGGGFVSGHRYSASLGLAGWVDQLGIVVCSLDYRLAPEHPYPAALDDARAALEWLFTYASDLGLDPGRIGVFGTSAGAGLAAALCLRARDDGGPVPSFAILQDPMLDDRLELPSTFEHMGEGVWDRESTITCWDAYLRGWRSVVPAYASPGRAADDPGALSGLPPTFLDVGTADLFRDETFAYAQALIRDGVPTELHVWPGGWHGFSEMAPDTRLARLANETRTRFLRRMLYDA